MTRTGLRVVALVLTLIAGVITPESLGAGSEPTITGRPVIDEPGTRLLREGGWQATVFDLDGDGIRELIRVEPRTNDPGLAQVVVISVAEDGTPTPLFSAPLEREVSVDEKGTPGYRGDFTPAKLGDGIEFRLIRINGEVQMLVAVTGYNENFAANCCLTLWRVELSDVLHGLRLLDATGQSYESLAIADLDADGTDELVTTRTIINGSTQHPELSLYRWDGTGYGRTDVVTPDLANLYSADTGETNGLPGEDVLLIGTENPDELNRLYRLFMRSGAPELEPATLEGINTALVVDVGSGQILTEGNGSGGTGVTLYEWPAGGDVEFVGSWSASGWPVGVIGSAEETRILLSPFATDYGYGLDVIDLGEIGYPSVSRRDSVEVTRGISQAAPHFGATVPGIGREDGFIYAGQIVEPAGPGLDVRLTPISLMAGMWPIGAVGPDGAWAVVQTYIETDIGRLETRIVATASLLTPNDEPLAPTFHRAAAGDEGQLLIKPDTDPVAEIVVPAGSQVISFVGSATPAVVDTALPEGSAPARPVRVSIPIAKVSGSQRSAYQVRVVVVTPAGHAYQGIWQVEPLPGPPGLTVLAPAGVMGSGVLRGTTYPLASVTVNGVPVPVGSNGAFRTELPLALLPTDIRVIATDPLGETSETVLSILNPVDYRRLPWIPIVAILTSLGGLIWWIRAPRRRPPARVTPSGSGTFEEIEI